MPEFVRPKVFLLGATGMIESGVKAYLEHVGCQKFWQSIEQAREIGISDGEILVSLYAKLCYKSLKIGQNANITRTRDIKDNLEGCYSTAHGSVFEHCNLNFVFTGCSRVLTHEQVRHRVGVAYSQTSGRYVRAVPIEFVEDTIIGPTATHRGRQLLEHIEQEYQLMVLESGIEADKDFDSKKMKTSALRRYLPNGQANEIGVTLNIRTLRHCLMVRTARFAEREIREVYGQVYEIVKERYPMMVSDARTRTMGGMLEVYGMKMQPYDLTVEA